MLKSRSEGHFRKESLPTPAAFWKDELRRMSRPSRGWSRSKCPLHGGDNPTAFSINIETGGFYCHSCGAKGGDLLDFIRLRYKVDFRGAAKMLGAWSDESLTAVERARTEKERWHAEKIRAAAEKLARDENTLRREIASDILLYQKLQRHFAKRLERDGEDEAAWEALAQLYDILRGLKTRHDFLLFGPIKDRTNFVMGNESIRKSITDRVLDSGWIRDDRGHFQEVGA